GTGAVADSRPGSQARRNESSASIHARVAHTSRVPLAMTSGTRATTTRPSVYQPERAGPVSNRNASVSVRGGRTRNPSVAGSAPISDHTHGEHNTRPTRAPTSATPADRSTRQPGRSNSVASASATATTGTNRTAGGQTLVATAARIPTTTTA